MSVSACAGRGRATRRYRACMHGARRTPILRFLRLAAVGALSFACTAAVVARPADDPPRRVRPGDAASQAEAAGDEPDAPRFPTALPAGAKLPESPNVAPVRADAFAGRVNALERVTACPKCDGKGAKVTRKRESRGQLAKPRITESAEECTECHGYGFAVTASRVGPVLDALAGGLAGLPPGLATGPKLMDRARAVLSRVGAGGELVAAVTAVDRNELAGGRLTKAGTPVTVAGEIGEPFQLPEGGRAYPVLVDGRELLLVRAPVINAAPQRGAVLVGGVLAGAMSGAEWDFGRTIVLDHGFIVPRTAPRKLRVDEPDADEPAANDANRNP